MVFVEIKGTPIDIELIYPELNVGPPCVLLPHSLGGPQGNTTWASFDLAKKFGPFVTSNLMGLLSTPLDQVFDETWSTQQGNATRLAIGGISKAAPNAYDIKVTFPPKGELLAETTGRLSATMQAKFPPGTNGSELWLNYVLPGVTASFSTTTEGGGAGGTAAGATAGGLIGGAVGSALGAAAGALLGAAIGGGGKWEDPSYSLTFDATYQVEIGVPATTFLTPQVLANFLVQNIKPGLGDFPSLGWLSALIIQIRDSINGQSTGNPPDQTISAGVPFQLELLLGAIFPDAESQGVVFPPLGFVDLAVRISTPPQGNTVEFDVTHPCDLKPVVTNRVGTPTLFRPLISTSTPQVHAGGILGVNGFYWPAGQSRQLTITWTDTTSGSVSQSEIQWGSTPDNHTPPALPTDKTITRYGPYDNGNNFTTPANLIPGTWYGLRVRDYDAANVIATEWSDWLFLQTAATDQVELALGDANGTVLGYATLQIDGTFAATVLIPVTEPPGTYTLTGLLDGQELASTTITVAGAGEVLPPLLQVIDADTGIAVTGAASIVATWRVTVRGQNFDPGPVELFVDGTGGASLGQATASAAGSFTAPFSWPWSATGSHSIWAQQNAKHASAPVYVQNPPS